MYLFSLVYNWNWTSSSTDNDKHIVWKVMDITVHNSLFKWFNEVIKWFWVWLKTYRLIFVSIIFSNIFQTICYTTLLTVNRVFSPKSRIHVFLIENYRAITCDGIFYTPLKFVSVESRCRSILLLLESFPLKQDWKT